MDMFVTTTFTIEGYRIRRYDASEVVSKGSATGSTVLRHGGHRRAGAIGSRSVLVSPAELALPLALRRQRDEHFVIPDKRWTNRSDMAQCSNDNIHCRDPPWLCWQPRSSCGPFSCVWARWARVPGVTKRRIVLATAVVIVLQVVLDVLLAPSLSELPRPWQYVLLVAALLRQWWSPAWSSLGLQGATACGRSRLAADVACPGGDCRLCAVGAAAFPV